MYKGVVRGVFISMLASAVSLAYAEKNYKDRGEFEAYDAVVKDFAAKNYSKAITDLESWIEKYPESDFKNDRQLLLVEAYSGLNQPAKTIDAGASLVSGDASAILDKPTDVLRLLYAIVSAIPQLPDPNASQMAAVQSAARQLIVYDKAPEGVTSEAWARSHAEFQRAANAALLYLTLIPIARSLKGNDCQAAESETIRAIETYPQSAQIAWYLGMAELCLYKTHPEKAAPALYAFARAAAIDSVKGVVDPKWQQSTVEPYLEKIYMQYHGVDPEGLKALKELAVQTPLPPAGFSIKSAGEIAQEQQDKFERENPDIALWMKIKQALTAPDGPQYFASGLKDTALPELRGVLVRAKPDCRPLELLVAVKTPESAQPLEAEIALKLAKPLMGRPETGSEIRWQGVATAFTSTPFMLTMDVEANQVQGLKTSPCTPVRARRPSAEAEQ